MTALTLGVASGMLLAGCSTGSDPGTGEPSNGLPSASGPVSSGASADPSPSSTLNAAQQQAFEEATEVVMAYRQTITDLYTGARTRINDLDDYLVAPQLERERNAVSQGIARGVRSEPEGARLVLISTEPVEIESEASQPTVVLWACIDGSALTGIEPDGTQVPGKSERLKYTVVKTDFLPAPGWAVKGVTGETDPKDRAC